MIYKIILLLICFYSLNASVSSFLSYYDNSACSGGALLIVTRFNTSQVVYGSNGDKCKKNVQCSNPSDESCKHPISYLTSIHLNKEDNTFYSVVNDQKSLEYEVGVCVRSINYKNCYYKVASSLNN